MNFKFFIELTTYSLLITETVSLEQTESCCLAQGHSGGNSWMNLCSIIHTDYHAWPCATENTTAEYLYC